MTTKTDDWCVQEKDLNDRWVDVPKLLEVLRNYQSSYLRQEFGATHAELEHALGVKLAMSDGQISIDHMVGRGDVCTVHTTLKVAGRTLAFKQRVELSGATIANAFTQFITLGDISIGDFEAKIAELRQARAEA